MFKNLGNNWFKACIDGYEIHAKVYDECSKYGIENGNVSKLEIKDLYTGELIINYDRGWDVMPTEKTNDIYEKILLYLSDVKK